MGHLVNVGNGLQYPYRQGNLQRVARLTELRLPLSAESVDLTLFSFSTEYIG